jgi:cytochrome c-type biogenesis protein CcmH/NrfG
MPVPASSTNAPAHNESVVPRLAVRLAVALACVAGVAVSVTSRDSRIATEDAYAHWIHTHDTRGTLERIDKARRLNPDYRLDLAEARTLPPKQGKSVLERSLKHEPENAELWVELSVVQARLGDFAGTARSDRRAQALAPRFLAPKKAPRRG